MTSTQIWMALGAAIYLGIGASCASRWFHHKDPLSVLLVALLWPLIWGLSLFTK